MSASLPAPPATRGLLDALRALGVTLGETLHVRGALLALEVRDEIDRRQAMLVLAGLGVAFVHLALLLAALLVVAIFWDTHRIAALGTVTVLYLACGAVALIALRARLAASADPFAASLGELERDLASFRADP